MALDPHELDKIDRIAEAVVRIDERTERMDLETNRRFEGVHKRIDEVKKDATRAGGKLGGASGGAVSVGLVALWETIKAQLSSP